MAPIELLRVLMADGVEFSTDGEMVRWRHSGGWMKPEVLDILLAGKGRGNRLSRKAAAWRATR